MTDREFIEKFAAQAVRFVGCVDEDNTRSFIVTDVQNPAYHKEIVDEWTRVELNAENFKNQGGTTIILEFQERKLEWVSAFWFDEDGVEYPTSISADIAMELLDLYRQMKDEAEDQP